jgi:hypothetical protein
MPTARELLEQADALMRRNRAAAVDDIPVLTDSVPIAEAPLPVRQKMREHAEPARAAPDPIPTLTERVDSSAKVGAGSMMGEGEPSDWLDMDQPQPSIMGDAPDSIAIVPPVELAHDLDDALLESAEHEEIELKSAVEDDFDEELAKRAAEQVVVAPAPVETSPVAPSALLPSSAAPAESVASPAAEQVMAPASEAQPASVPAAEVAAPEPEAEVAPPQTAEELVAPMPAEEATASAARSLWDDQARWDVAAEEIRMQVLQRIDLFTDTGLREQLGSRLKPIVDNASADLVATINQHVGELLRAYVAEAIEREIERWREQH